RRQRRGPQRLRRGLPGGARQVEPPRGRPGRRVPPALAALSPQRRHVRRGLLRSRRAADRRGGVPPSRAGVAAVGGRRCVRARPDGEAGDRAGQVRELDRAARAGRARAARRVRVRAPERRLMPNAAQQILRAGDDASVALRVHADDRRLAVTRGELRRLVRQTAAALARRGVVRGQRVLVALPDCPEYVAAVLGAMGNGSVPVRVSTFLPAGGPGAFLEESGARAVVATEPIADAVREQAGASAVAVLTVRGDGGGTFREAVGGEPTEAEPVPVHGDDPALLLYSSGTTGRPKAVVHLHRGLLHAIDSYGVHVLETPARDLSYATSKLFFAYGRGASLYFPLAAGGAAVLSPEPFAPARSWRILLEERPSLLFAVPGVYRALLEHAPPEAPDALAGVRRFVCAGET